MNKKIISTILVVSILSISVFAAAPNVTDGADVNSDMSDYPSYPSSSSVTSDVTYVQPIVPAPNYPNNIVSTIGDLWNNLRTFCMDFTSGLQQTLANVVNIASYVLNIKTYLQINSANGNTVGNRINDINSNIYYAYNGPLKGVFNMLSSTNGASGGWYYRIFKALYDPNNPNDGLIYGIYSRLATIINNNSLTQSDIHGLYTMFASGQVGGSAYYNQLIASGGALENIENSSSNSATAVAGIRTDLIDYLTYTDALNNSGLSVFKDRQGHNFLNGIDSATSDLLNYFYDFFIDDDMPTSTNGGEAIVGLYNNSNSIVSGYGYNSNSTLASAISGISSKEDTQIDELRNIVDVLANQNDKTIVNNQTDNKTTVIPIFFAPSNTNNTSLNTNDFTNLGGIVRAIRNLLDTGISLAGFSAALDEAADEGLEFFQQSTIDDMYNSDYLGAYS